ncbi:MAG: hypothetical protein ABIF01_03675 [Candidatus Micrarchaeota archaeon]
MSSRGERKTIARLKALERGLQGMRGKPILVEGKRDTESLERHIKERIIPVNGNPKKLAKLLKGEEEAVVLTDFDSAGEELLVMLSEELRSIGVKPDIECRRLFRYALGLARFEEFSRRYEELIEEGERYGKNIH